MGAGDHLRHLTCDMIGAWRSDSSLTCNFSCLAGWICALIGGLSSGRVPYAQPVKTAPGATAVQIVYAAHRGSRDKAHEFRLTLPPVSHPEQRHRDMTAGSLPVR